MKRKVRRWHSLAFQVITVIVVMAILPVVLIALPAYYYLDHQRLLFINRELELGSQTAQLFLSQKISELEQLVDSSVAVNSPVKINQPGFKYGENSLDPILYYDRFDLVIWCNLKDIVVLIGELPSSLEAPVFCNLRDHSILISKQDDETKTGWMLLSRSIAGNLANATLVFALKVDDRLVLPIYEQTGMHYMLFYNQDLLASSWQNGSISFIPLLTLSRTGETQFRQISGDVIASRFDRLPGTMLEIMTLLPVKNDPAVNDSFVRWGLSAVLLVAISGVILALWLVRSFGRPLDQLHGAAQTLRSGDLYTPIALHTHIREVDQIGYALEDARVTLYHGLAQLRQEKQWGEHLLESIVEGVVTIDPRGRITYFSHGAERITGSNAHQVIGHSIDTVFRLADSSEPFSRHMPAPGGAQKINTLLLDGRLVTLSITGSRLAPPQTSKASVALVLRDVSNEEAIRKLLGDFLANITHEFRTPLAAQAASIELLLDQLPDLSQDELRDLINSIHLGALGLQTLIDNLLEGASIETGHFKVFAGPSDLQEIIQNISQTLNPLADKYGQKIRHEIPAFLPLVQVDRRRTGQVFINLISNAIKWGPNGGEILLSVSVIEDGQVRVEVSDQGPGILDGDRQPEIFQRFARHLANSTSGERGAGLGLSVVKEIVEAQGGQVGAHNRSQGGAVFWFTLPVCKETGV